MELGTFDIRTRKEQKEIEDKFKDLYDMFCYEADGRWTKEFEIFVKEGVDE